MTKRKKLFYEVWPNQTPAQTHQRARRHPRHDHRRVSLRLCALFPGESKSGAEKPPPPSRFNTPPPPASNASISTPAPSRKSSSFPATSIRPSPGSKPKESPNRNVNGSKSFPRVAAQLARLIVSRSGNQHQKPIHPPRDRPKTFRMHPPPATITRVMQPPDDESLIRRAAEILRAGGLVAFATETVYGLGADATNARAVRKFSPSRAARRQIRSSSTSRNSDRQTIRHHWPESANASPSLLARTAHNGLSQTPTIDPQSPPACRRSPSVAQIIPSP